MYDACSKGFIRLTKSHESGATLYFAKPPMRTCANYRFIFPNGDLSAGYVQVPLPNGEYLAVVEKLAEWQTKGVKASLVLKR